MRVPVVLHEPLQCLQNPDLGYPAVNHLQVAEQDDAVTAAGIFFY